MHSFDVFDTLITRITATPDGIFHIMQRQLQQEGMFPEIPKFVVENFFELRKNAEVLARKTYTGKGIEDITLEQIYEAMSTTGLLSERGIQELLQLERDTEIKCSLGIDENIIMVKKLIEKKEKVVLISDMYLDEKTIRKMLVKVDPVFDSINLYVSSEFKKTKGSTNLFWVVKKKEGAEFSQWIHLGDNPHADGEAPQKIRDSDNGLSL
jgi:predicted HAD superfamily hydrolase